MKCFCFKEGTPSNLNTHCECVNQQHRSNNGISHENPDQNHKPQLGKALPMPISEPSIQYTKVSSNEMIQNREIDTGMDVV